MQVYHVEYRPPDRFSPADSESLGWLSHSASKDAPDGHLEGALRVCRKSGGAHRF